MPRNTLAAALTDSQTVVPINTWISQPSFITTNCIIP